MTSLSLSLRSAALLAAAATSHALLPAQCGVDPNYGTSIPLTDDSVSGVQMLGFAFPFAGASYDSVYVSSNGFVYLFDTTGSVLPPTNSRCCNGNVAGLLSSTSPMVCGMWEDLNPAAGGTVNFNALPGKALITWDNVPEFGNAGSANTFQIRLHATSGVIEMAFDSNTRAISHACLTGWSPSNGAADPGGSNLSAIPILAGSATVYELFGPGSFDLAQRSLQASPTSATSWIVDTPFGCALSSEYGRGCPKPCTFYEFFAGSTFDLSGGSLLFSAVGNGAYSVSTCPTNCFDTNFTNNLLLTDDSLSVGNALGFTFPFCGGSTTTVDVCSNGFVWLVSGSSGSFDWTPTVAELLALPARLCPLWMDLNPTAGGAVYFDALPGKALVTWNQVPAFGVAGSRNTIQVQIYPNGNLIVAWPQAVNNATTGGNAISGFSQGNGISDPSATDISMVPFSTGSGIPMRLAAQPGSRPVIGTTLMLEASQVRPGTLGGSLHIGTSNPNLDLTPIGLSGCTWLSTLDITLPLTVASPITTVSLPIPNLSSFIGRSLTTQVLMLDPSLGGALPLYLSNGLLLTFGN